MFQKIVIAIAIALFAAGSVLAAQDTGGDKRHRASNRAQPPDPLISHKSPGRNKRSRHHHRTPDALTVKQKSKASNTARQ